MAQITEYLETILQGRDLSFDKAKDLLDIIFAGEVAEAQVAAFLAAMRAKGASVPELAGLARSLRDHAVKVDTGLDDLVDTCGTGGAKLKTFNISTTAALVAAGAGVYVAKHGNRGMTSKCGSADVLTELGVNVSCGPQLVAECIRQAHVGFMFAPMFHPAMKYVQPTRKALGVRTVFNILGPLANPAQAQAQVMGVAEESLMNKIIETLKMLGVERAIIVHSEGLDEISTMGPTKIMQLKAGQVTAEQIKPSDFGIATADFDSLKGDDARTNAKITRDILSGKERGAKKDVVLLNAAAAMIVSGKAEDFAGGVKLANKAIEQGAAAQALEKLIEISNS